MNILLISSSASYHHIAQKMSKESAVDTIWHYGANASIEPNEKYIPISQFLPYDRRLYKNDIDNILKDIVLNKIDLVLSSHLSISGIPELHSLLQEKKIPYFFVEPNVTHLELDRIKTKRLLKSLNIPHGQGHEYNGRYLFENFNQLSFPLVIKIKSFMHGRQTIVVNENNKQQVYNQLFSIFLNQPPDKMNIGMDTELVIEQYIEIEKEFSYHALVNKEGWSYLGSARDYKTLEENDQGYNTIGLGSYSLESIHDFAHLYADSIITKVQSYLKLQSQYYKGFMFINFAESKDGRLYVLEINTRAGEPEIDSIMETITNPFSEMLFDFATNCRPFEIDRNQKKSMAVRIIKKNMDWTKPGYLELNLKEFPKYLDLSLQGNDGLDLYPAIISAQGDSFLELRKKIYGYLGTQDLSGFYFRKDIGLD